MVVVTYSIAANLTGWLLAMNRAMMSIITCSGAQIPAIVNGTAKPGGGHGAGTRQLHRITPATRNPVTMYAARIMCAVSYGRGT